MNHIAIFKKKIDHALNLHFPLKTVEIKYNNRVPYITRGIKQSTKQKHELYDTYWVFSPIRERADNLSLMKKTLFLHSFL